MNIITRTETLHNQYPGQFNAQDVYLEIDPEAETMSMGINPEIGNAVPSDVWHGRRIRYTLPIVPTIEAANEFMAEIAPLAERIIAGHDTKWNGNNHVGVMDEDAQAANDELEDKIYHMAEDGTDQQMVWSWDYCYEGFRNEFHADASDEQVAASIAETESAAADENATIDCDLMGEINIHRYAARWEAIEDTLNGDDSVDDFTETSGTDENPIFEAILTDGTKQRVYFDAAGVMVREGAAHEK